MRTRAAAATAHPWLAPASVAVAGTILLVARPRLDVTGRGVPPLVLVGLTVAIAAGALLVPVPDRGGRRRLAPAAVLAAGLAGVAAAALAGGRPVPLPATISTLPLSLAAAVAEEALFRRAAYGALSVRGPLVAVAGSAVLFALIHVPLYGTWALPVDLGAGLVFGWQRWASGTWTVPAATHAAANLLAVIVR